MTDQEIIDYYADLLILQYSGQPNAYATIQALASLVVADQLPVAIQDAFDIDTATGVQLDSIGKYAGVTRYGNGISGPITLSDADFRTFIKIAVVKNHSDGTLASIQSLLDIYFPGTILVFDYQNMHMSYLLNSSIGSQDLAQLFVSEGLLPKPMGVQLAATIFASDISHFFGFRTYDLVGFNNEPFNTYDVYTTTWPWLSYSSAVVV